MKIFSTKERTFKIYGTADESLDRLRRRTEESSYLTSAYTDQSFRGMINGNQFKIISSTIGSGAFCVMTGEISSDIGHVKVEIHKVFKVLLNIILCFPIVGISMQILSGTAQLSVYLILVAIAQVLFIRFVVISVAFKLLSKSSLNRLRDILDFEWIKN